MVIGTAPEEFARLELDDYEVFGRPLKGFDPYAPEQIQIFSERMKEIRKNRRKEHKVETL